MELQDFTEKEQSQIKKGLSTAEITDREAAEKILALVPEAWIRAIPFFCKGTCHDEDGGEDREGASGSVCGGEAGRRAAGEGEGSAPGDRGRDLPGEDEEASYQELSKVVRQQKGKNYDEI